MNLRIFIFCLVNVLLYNRAEAQLCQGSLGDPIINITFGNGTAQGNSLAAASTSYQFVANDCPLDGFYTVRNTTNSCYGNTWHTLNSDHTADGNGYFMLVNASYQPSAFYIDTVRGLCGNTTFEFASWIMNMVLASSCGGNTIQPNITFTIEKTDGTVLNTYNSGNIPAASGPVWKQYGFYFTTPSAGSDIVLRIVNNAPGGCGNDLALDDITFRPCGTMISRQINGANASPINICEGTAGAFSLNCTTSGGFLVPSFQWQQKGPSSAIWTDITGAVTNTYNFSIPANAAPGVYQYRLAVFESGNINSPQCYVYSQPFLFTINAKPVIGISNNGPVCAGGAVTLTATGGVTYAWRGPNGYAGSGSPLILNNITASAKYYVTVSNSEGCSKLDSTSIVVNPSPVAVSNPDSIAICKGDSVRLNASGGSDFLWSPAGGLSGITNASTMASPLASVTYQVIVSNQFACRDTAFSVINVLEKPVANAGNDLIILHGQSVQLNGSITGDGQHVWSPPAYLDDATLLQPTAMPPSDIRYVLNVTSNAGCGLSTDTMNIKVYDDIFIPNAFTPNNDGINDTWNITSLKAYAEFEVTIFSRWGEKLFYTRNVLLPWDGTFKGADLPMGGYHYIITAGPMKQVFKGSVLLIR